MALQTVHIRVNDTADGRPTPVRLRVTDAAGTYYAPIGHAADFPTGPGEAVGGDVMIGAERWAYIDGTCEIALPPGALTVEVRKGPEYRPLREVVDLPAGKLALRFSVERWTNLRAEGWYSGDTRAHFLSPHAALVEAAAEDVAVVNLLAHEAPFLCNDGQTRPAYPNLTAFSGQAPCLERPGHLVVVNTHNRHPVLGRLGLLNCHRAVYPLTFGGPDGSDDWSLADWCGQCHRKGGLVVWTDAFPEPGFAGEALANLILGNVDALELDPRSPARARAWYQLLNAGLRVPIVAASAKDSNRTPIGALRTYAQLKLDQAFDYAAWIAAVKAGRTFVTSGLLFYLHVQGYDAGTVHRRPAGDTTFRLAFGAFDNEPYERVEVLANGSVVASGQGSELYADVELSAGGWVAARCLGGGRLLAHTSPVYVEVEGVPPPVAPATVTFVLDHLDRTREWVETQGRFEKPRSREHLFGLIDAARQRVLEQTRGLDTVPGS
jgi:hypothetical protein